MVRVGRRASADDTWLCGYEFAVVLIAQANGLLRRTAAAGGGLFGEGNARCLVMRIGTGGFSSVQTLGGVTAIEGRQLDLKSHFNKLGISDGQRILRRQAPMCPTGRIIGSIG